MAGTLRVEPEGRLSPGHDRLIENGRTLSPFWAFWRAWLFGGLAAFGLGLGLGLGASSPSSSSSAGTSSAVVSAISSTDLATQSLFSMAPLSLSCLVDRGDLVVGEIGDLLELDQAELVQLVLELLA